MTRHCILSLLSRASCCLSRGLERRPVNAIVVAWFAVCGTIACVRCRCNDFSTAKAFDVSFTGTGAGSLKEIAALDKRKRPARGGEKGEEEACGWMDWPISQCRFPFRNRFSPFPCQLLSPLSPCLGCFLPVSDTASSSWLFLLVQGDREFRIHPVFAFWYRPVCTST
jgi:hypothetical protein